MVEIKHKDTGEVLATFTYIICVQDDKIDIYQYKGVAP
jgi:hypothetical protein